MSALAPPAASPTPARSIALAPRSDLHTGYHGAILAGPPAGHSLRPVAAEHLFLMRECENSPSESAHFFEAIRCAGSPRAVHSARWPVLECPAWLADMDDLLYPLLFGRTASNPDFLARARGEDPQARALLAQRARTMLSAYLHPSCATILFRGHPRLRLKVAREWFEFLGVQEPGEAVLEKLTIVRPAQRAANAAMVQRKWNAPERLRVLFCGRDFDVKRGLLTLQVMQRVMREHPSVEFTYVGPIPSEVRATCPELLRAIEHYEHVPHEAMLEQMRNTHLYFHPSRHESIGIALLEAMGAGASVVAARGEATEYTDELFDDGGALLLDRDRTSAADEAAGFEQLLHQALGDVDRMAELGMRNHRATAIGKFSISRQAGVLAKAYDSLFEMQGPSLTLDQIEPVKGSCVRRFCEKDLRDDVQASRDARRVPAGYRATLI